MYQCPTSQENFTNPAKCSLVEPDFNLSSYIRQISSYPALSMSEERTSFSNEDIISLNTSLFVPFLYRSSHIESISIFKGRLFLYRVVELYLNVSFCIPLWINF